MNERPYFCCGQLPSEGHDVRCQSEDACDQRVAERMCCEEMAKQTDSLLEALRNLVELVEHQAPHAARWPDVEAARAAIARAEGVNGARHIEGIANTWKAALVAHATNCPQCHAAILNAARDK